MKKLRLSLFFLLTACSGLTRYEQRELVELNSYGISVDNPQSNWQKPANPFVAGGMNIISGMGNFYLASGEAGDDEHYNYGIWNLITFPISWVWSIPEAAIDANNINKRDLIWYYTHDRRGIAEFAKIKAEVDKEMVK